jgi:DNA topoisomerase-1
VGSFESTDVVVSVGRFGPYVKHNSGFYSLAKDDDPLTVTLQRAIEIIEEKRKKEDQKTIKSFTGDESIKILNGRYGPYISFNKRNYKIPKGSDPAGLTLEDCRKIIKETEPSKNKSVKRNK